MDVKKLLKAGKAEEIKEYEKKYKESIDELVEYGKDKEGFIEKEDNQFILNYGDRIIIEDEEGIYGGQKGLAPGFNISIDHVQNFISILMDAKDIVTIYGKKYKIDLLSKFTKELYSQIKNEPNGFEGKDEVPLAEYCSRKPKHPQIDILNKQADEEIADEAPFRKRSVY